MSVVRTEAAKKLSGYPAQDLKPCFSNKPGNGIFRRELDAVVSQDCPCRVRARRTFRHANGPQSWILEGQDADFDNLQENGKIRPAKLFTLIALSFAQRHGTDRSPSKYRQKPGFRNRKMPKRIWPKPALRRTWIIPTSCPSVTWARTEDGSIYVVSKFIAGSTLEDRIKAGRPPERESTQLLVKVALALKHAHDGRQIHRDIKPANILLEGKSNAPYRLLI